jgi:hypothetical protein
MELLQIFVNKKEQGQMPIRPNEETILATFSLTELLDLAWEKEKQDRTKQKEEVERHLSAIKGMLAESSSQLRSENAEAQKAPTTSALKTQKKRGRKPGRKSDQRPAEQVAQKIEPVSSAKSSETPEQNSEKKKPLSALLVESVGKEPMSMDQIVESAEKLGWKTKSKNPRQIVFLELGKQIEKGALKKAGRGMYVKG